MADLDVTTGERVQNALVSADAGAGAGTLAKVLADIEAAIAAKQDAEATLAALALLNDTPVGTGSDQLCAGNDGRLSDARTPTAHATSHESGGGDAIKLDDLSAPDDNTDLNATTSAHGLCPKLGGGTTNFLRADGTWNAPSVGGVAWGSITGTLSDQTDLATFVGANSLSASAATSYTLSDPTIDLAEISITGNTGTFTVNVPSGSYTSVRRIRFRLVNNGGVQTTVAFSGFSTGTYYPGDVAPNLVISATAGATREYDVWTDGTDFYVLGDLNTDSLSAESSPASTDRLLLWDASASAWKYTTIANLPAGGSSETTVYDIGDVASGTTAPTLANGGYQTMRMTGDSTLNVASVFSGLSSTLGELAVQVKQDGTGGRVLTISGVTNWPYGIAPQLPTAANAICILKFVSPDAGTTIFADMSFATV